MRPWAVHVDVEVHVHVHDLDAAPVPGWCLMARLTALPCWRNDDRLGGDFVPLDTLRLALGQRGAFFSAQLRARGFTAFGRTFCPPDFGQPVLVNQATV